MQRPVVTMLALSLAGVLFSGCGGRTESPPTTEPPTAQTPAAAVPAGTSPYDAGARAGEAAVDGGLAAKGEKLFQTKGCAVCHGFGKKITCPDLVGVSMRRTATWMEHQILHPEIMVKEDPITMDLKKSYALPMTNQNVKPEEARALIEFLKRKDHQAGVIK